MRFCGLCAISLERSFFEESSAYLNYFCTDGGKEIGHLCSSCQDQFRHNSRKVAEEISEPLLAAGVAKARSNQARGKIFDIWTMCVPLLL